jgi:serine/threonine protein kinase
MSNDIPPEWKVIESLPEGGQGHTYVVEKNDGSDSHKYALKRLKNSARARYFEREIQACMALNHPSVLKLVAHGTTPKGKPYFVSEYCSAGSLAEAGRFSQLGEGLRFFEQIVAGVAHAHSQSNPIFHLDIKPENIFLMGDRPVVGDWGICFVADGQFSLTGEGPLGSIYYCAPELRKRKIEGAPALATADVYSLGKVLYFLLASEVYDGHEDDYIDDPSRRIAKLFGGDPQADFVDQIIAKTIQKNPANRLSNAIELLALVQETARRLEAGGRVLNMQIPQRCLYCAEGKYVPLHETNWDTFSGPSKYPDIARRRKGEVSTLYPEQGPFAPVRNIAASYLGANKTGMPLLLACDYCGNIQYFRLDKTKDQHGENWRP